MVGTTRRLEQKFVQQVIGVCKAVLAADLTIEEFFERWPSECDEDPFVSLVLEDSEDGVEHTPGRLFSGEVDLELWRRSEAFLVLSLDVMLLDLGVSQGLSSNTLVAIRSRVLEKGLPGVDALDKSVSEAVEAVRPGKTGSMGP